ncbi:hypothetical protein AGMMS49992_26030 [Clostridia bacterium]|nr:hypothetical protein AGMMS49992_26030 [Clostridia bacterium]
MGYLDYGKMIKKMIDHKYNTYWVKKYGVISQKSYVNIMKGNSNLGPIQTDTIAAMCQLFEAQPGDLLEYVEDDQTASNSERSEPNA